MRREPSWVGAVGLLEKIALSGLLRLSLLKFRLFRNRKYNN